MKRKKLDESETHEDNLTTLDQRISIQVNPSVDLKNENSDIVKIPMIQTQSNN